MFVWGTQGTSICQLHLIRSF